MKTENLELKEIVMQIQKRNFEIQNKQENFFERILEIEVLK